jgi:transposase
MNLPPLGLDVAKLKFNACFVRADSKLRHKVFANNPQGFSQLSDWLKQQGAIKVHACMEATGTYCDSLATYLHEQDHPVSVVNPAAIKAYAQSHLSRTKTDRVDAARSLASAANADRQPGARPSVKCRNFKHLCVAWSLWSRCERWRRIASPQVSRSKPCVSQLRS